MNYRVCLTCRRPFSAAREPRESRPVREYQSGADVHLHISASGHICEPCAQREADGTVSPPREGSPIRT